MGGVRERTIQRKPHTRSQPTTTAGLNFYNQHILCVAPNHKEGNHKGAFHKRGYLKVKRHPPKVKVLLRPGQSSYITKEELEVVDIGRHKTERPENLGFVICGRDQDIEGVAGVIPEHLSTNFSLRKKNFKKKNEIEVETSRGNFTVDSQERAYVGPIPPGEGYETQDVQEDTEDFFGGDQDQFSTTDVHWPTLT